MLRSTHVPRIGKQGFTLIEILVTIAIIALLASLLFPLITRLQVNQKLVESQRLQNEIGVALTIYLDEYPLLGNAADEDSSDFSTRPVDFIVSDDVDATDSYLLDIPLTKLTDDGQILDAFGLPLAIEVNNGPTGGPYSYTDVIRIRCTAGTPSDESDDQVIMMTITGDVDRDGNPDAGIPTHSWFDESRN